MSRCAARLVEAKRHYRHHGQLVRAIMSRIDDNHRKKKYQFNEGGPCKRRLWLKWLKRWCALRFLRFPQWSARFIISNLIRSVIITGGSLYWLLILFFSITYAIYWFLPPSCCNFVVLFGFFFFFLKNAAVRLRLRLRRIILGIKRVSFWWGKCESKAVLQPDGAEVRCAATWAQSCECDWVQSWVLLKGCCRNASQETANKQIASLYQFINTNSHSLH